MTIIPIKISRKGGAGSGNWGHAGRPGLVGGSGGVGRIGPGLASGTGDEHGYDAADDFMDTVAGGGRMEDLGGWQAASSAERAAAKRAIITELADRTGLPEEDINNIISQWAQTSNDADMRALSLQQAAAEELGLELSDWQQENYDAASSVDVSWVRKQAPWMTQEQIAKEEAKIRADPRYNSLLPRDQERAIIRAMYDNTQAQLARAGFGPEDTISLARGITYDANPNLPSYEDVDYKGNTMESWSASLYVAKTFATDDGDYSNWGAVVTMEVPVKNIIGTARTGFGCLSEGEFVVAGNMPGQKVNVWETFKPYTEMSEHEKAGIFGSLTESEYMTEMMAKYP